MGYGGNFQKMIEQSLLSTHTAFFAKVISVSGNTAKIQPLNMVKAVGKNPEKQQAFTVPVMRNVKKLTEKEITVNGEKITVCIPKSISAGDTVYCLCAERDITETKKGNFAVPAYGHHSLSDAVVIGVV